MRRPGWGWRVWAAVGAVAVVVVAVVWGAAVVHALVPMSRPGWDRLDPATRAQAEGQFRLATIQGLAALGAGFALLYTARNFRLNRRGQVTERFTKALERLGSDLPYVRSGGIFALEQIVQDAPEQKDHITRILVAFLRDRAPAAGTKGLPDHPDPDVQTALTTLGLLKPTGALVDLSCLHLSGANLRGASLRGANLRDAHLNGANLRDAHLNGASLRGANLRDAHLNGATLTSANLRDAHLHNAHLNGAYLNGASLMGAFLTGAHLNDAYLNGVNLTDAHLTHAHLDGAHLNGAGLTDAGLSDAGLTRANLTGANLDGANLNGANLKGANLKGTNLASQI
ncbi:pentapeptide repeat-containing protein [Embleya sp. AB8]|uniref:pentapeptide repeat-containing protein n=1 Tax=Embleya sp. AB8 TaxID=3156304 RepID=UPI003C721543